MEPSSDQTLETERKNTDKSLGDEREKTNCTLIQAKGKAESQTDVSVQQARTDTDKATLVARTNADSRRDQVRKAQGYAEEDRASDDHSEAERTRADVTLEQERTRVDFAIAREREAKSSVEKTFLSQERELTDKSLSVERTRADTVVTSSTVKLSREVAEHSKTKVSLMTRDEFLAIVSHDLKNPIGAVSSCMDMLLEQTAERNLDSETRGWLEMAKRNADTALRLISDILDMERIADGKLELDKTTCNLGKVVRDSMEIFVHAAISKNILLRSVPPAATGEISCDRDRIVQVLSNLIGNALKFTPEGGKIVVKVERTDKEITFSVCDTGPGIPDEKKQKIFEKFTQLESKDRRGLGLGLHISKRLVESHGGNIWVESKLGQGSTFYFSIPRDRTYGSNPLDCAR